MSAEKEKEKEVVETVEKVNGIQETELGSDASDDDEEPATTAAGESVQLHAATPSTTSKKKKKKRSKAVQVLNAIRGDGVSKEVVNAVMEKVHAEGGEVAASANEAMIRMALEQMKLKSVLQGKAGVAGRNRKDAGDHKVRNAFYLGPFFSLYLTIIVSVLGNSTGTSVRWAQVQLLPNLF